jgi:hypothetical protein
MMKKSLLIAVTCCFLPHLRAQTQLNLTVGGGMYVVTAANTLSLPAMHWQIGANLSRQAFEKKWTLGMSFDYHRMCWADLVLPTPTQGSYFMMLRGAKNFTALYNIWSLPIYAQWNAYKLKPMLGLAFEYKNARSQNWELNVNSDFDGTKYQRYISDFKMSLWTGIEFPWARNRVIRLNYIHEIIGNEPVRQPYATPEYHKVRNYRFDLTVVTGLGKLGG